jgi:hypothetical protein
MIQHMWADVSSNNREYFLNKVILVQITYLTSNSNSLQISLKFLMKLVELFLWLVVKSNLKISEHNLLLSRFLANINFMYLNNSSMLRILRILRVFEIWEFLDKPVMNLIKLFWLMFKRRQYKVVDQKVQGSIFYIKIKVI